MNKFKISILALTLTSTLILSEVSASNFSDTTGTPEAEAAEDLNARGIISGYADGEFKGWKPVNRAEAAKMLVLSQSGKKEPDHLGTSFHDVDKNQWYLPYVARANELNIINGHPDGSFKPGDTINTAEFMKMIHRTFGLEEGLPHTYRDVPEGVWFEKYAGDIERKNLFPFRKTNNLFPSFELGRAEIAIAIHQYFEWEKLESVAEAKACNYNGKEYKGGDTFKSKDNCSDCKCDEGNVLCEAKSCDWAFESEVVTLGIGDKLVTPRGDELILNDMKPKNEGAFFKVFEKINGKLRETNNLVMIADYIKTAYFYGGLYFRDTSINYEGQKLTIEKYNSCLPLYNQCIQEKIKYESGPETSNKELRCSKICEEEPSPIEYLYEPGGKIKGVFPKEFKEYGKTLTDGYSFCYEKLKNYFEFDIKNEELFIKLMIVDSNGGGASSGGNNEYIYDTKEGVKQENLNEIREKINKGVCPGNGAAPHELTHTFLRKTIISPDSYYSNASLGVQWLNEGLANYMQMNLINKKEDPKNEYTYPITCYENKYKKFSGVEGKYVKLSSENSSFTDEFYDTGLCFWDYIYTSFGEAKFKKLLQYIATTRYKAGTYRLFDEFKKALGKDISDIAGERFGLDPDLTVEIK